MHFGLKDERTYEHGFTFKTIVLTPSFVILRPTQMFDVRYGSRRHVFEASLPTDSGRVTFETSYACQAEQEERVR